MRSATSTTSVFPGGNTANRFPSQVRLEDLTLVAPFGLGTEQRGVGIPQEHLSVLTVMRVYADANAHRDVQLSLLDAMWHAQGSEYRVAPHGGVFGASHFREQHHELVPTETTHGVGVAHARHQTSRDRLQHPIADQVA